WLKSAPSKDVDACEDLVTMAALSTPTGSSASLLELGHSNGRIIMREYRLMAARWFCLGLFMLAGCAAQPTGTASQATVPALQPSMARVWVLRQPSAPGGNVAAADPMVYANAAPLAQSAQGTVFFHDFQPGTYRFTVQAYGTPTNVVDTLQL